MKTALLTLISVLAFQSAYANGVSVRGGGKGVVCRDSRNKILSVELLDLWEARKFYNRTIPESNVSVAKQTKAAIQRLKYVNNFMPSMTSNAKLRPEDKVAAGVLNRAKEFFDPKAPNIRRLKGVALTLTHDSFEVIRPQEPGCDIEQIVVYQDRTGQPAEILINQDLYVKMSLTQRAALITHEALYSYLRMAEDPDSVRTRRTVGFIFEGNRFPNLYKVLPKTYTACYIEKPGTPHRIPYLFFYWGGKGLNVVRNHDLRFLPLFGYYPAEVNIGLIQQLNEKDMTDVLKNLFSPNLCDIEYLKTPGNILSGYLTMPGTGPVDYDHANSVQLACLTDGTRELKMVQGDVIENNVSRTRQLYCEEMQNP